MRVLDELKERLMAKVVEVDGLQSSSDLHHLRGMGVPDGAPHSG
jgi:hypothetical protein